MKSTRVLSALAVITAAGAPALAAFSTVNAPSGLELSHESIFEGIYGGNFVMGGNNFAGSGASLGIMATRVNDTGPGSHMNVLTGSAGSGEDDQTWQDGIVFSNARARYAGFSQHFGYIDNASGADPFQSVFQVTSQGLNPDMNSLPNFTETTIFSDPFRFARANTAGGANKFSSNPIDNIGGADHMVAYEITGVNGGRKTWWLFFEDQQMGVGDFDYNDLVVELVVVPLPASVYGGLAGLGLVGTGMMARRRRLSR